MLFNTNEESLEIEVAGYEFPEGVGEDADWLVLKGTYKADGTVTKDRSSCLTAGELQELTAGLKVLAAGIKDVALRSKNLGNAAAHRTCALF